MIEVIAYIKLYKHVRKIPFKSGYRPLFNFIANMKTSGKIELIDKDEFCSGETGKVKISFLNQEYLGGKLFEGQKFTLGEGKEPLGEGEIIKVVKSPQ